MEAGRPVLEGARRSSRWCRVLDRVVGPPVLVVLGRMRKRRRKPDRIAVVTLRPQRVFASLAALRRLRADVLIDFDAWPHVNAVLTALSGAAYTIGYRSERRHRHLAYDAVVPHGRTDHEVSNQGRLVQALTGTPCGPPIRGLLGLLDGADAVVSVNTGVMHVAAALGRPTVGLSGPTDPARWGPYGAHTRSVSPSGGRHSYLHLGHEYPRDATSPMHHLAVDQVEAALASIL